MSPVEEELKALLAPLREAQPGPHSAVDVVRAVRVGRRHQRGRIVAGVAAVVALVALPVILVPSVLHSSPPADSPMPLPVDHRVFDVGTAGGYRPTNDMFQGVALARTDNGPDFGHVMVFRGHEPFGQEAEPVNGHRAYWGPEVSNTTLIVEGPNGLWATISLDGTNPDLKARAHRVAESVTFTSAPVTVPFTLTNPAMRIHSYQISPATHAAMITVGAPGRSADVIIKVQPGSEVSVETNFVPNRTIANQPAKLTDGRIILRTPSGFTVDVVSAPETTEAEMTALVTSVRLVGDPRDVSTWVRAPIQ